MFVNCHLKSGDCANNILCTFPFLPPGYLASSRRSAQERGDVDGPPRRGSGFSYNKLQPWGPEPGWGGHVTGDAAPETAVAQRGERWARSAQDHQSTRPLLYLFKGPHALVLILFTMCAHSWNADWWSIQDIMRHISAGWVVLSESQGKLLEQSCPLFRPSRLPVLESHRLLNAVSEVTCDGHCIFGTRPRNVYLIKVEHIVALVAVISWSYFNVFWFKPIRSLCTLVCKWTYCPPDGWDSSFWSSIGLEDLLENNFSKIGKLKRSIKPLRNVH